LNSSRRWAGPLPSDGIQEMPPTEKKKIVRPSGVQIGEASLSGLKVNRVVVFFFRLWTQMSELPLSPEAIARNWPSGEKRGAEKWPAICTRGASFPV